MSLARSFLARLGPRRGDWEGRVDLESYLEAIVASARRTWPEVSLSPELFVQHLADKVPEDGDPFEGLKALATADLYLAAACAAGDARALAAFEEHQLAQIAAVLARGRATPALAEELKQTLRARLLVADGGPPRIALYSGRGPLAAWLRVIAARLLIDARRAERAEIGTAEVDSELELPAGIDPELAYLQRQYVAEFETALRNALSTLDGRDAAVLRLHHLERMSPRAIAAMYRASPRTVQHWLTEARRRILDEVRREIASRLQLSVASIDGLMGLVRSQLEVSIHKYLKDPGNGRT